MMHFPLITQLENRLKLPLPGVEAQFRMAPSIRKPMDFPDVMKNKPVKSSVLVLLYPSNGELYTVLIKRNEYDGMHSNQVSLPGGKMDVTDRDEAHTALREAEEETGIIANDVTLLGQLTTFYVQPSNYIVYPFVGYINYTPEFKPEIKEVQFLIEAPVSLLRDKSIVKKTDIKVRQGIVLEAPYYDISGHIVWGATAMMLSEFITILDQLSE
jgi:8-oxo-dGTP pyrophosphatase MutT (NUDIX family)